MSDTDAQAHFAAVKAVLVAEFGEHVYDYGTVPGTDGNSGTMPARYLLLTVERRTQPQVRASARTSVSAWRATVRGVGRWLPENARTALAEAAAALNEQRLTIGGQTSTPVQFESGQAPEPDGPEHYSGLDLYTYAL